MVTKTLDYDRPRQTESDAVTQVESLEELHSRRHKQLAEDIDGLLAQDEVLELPEQFLDEELVVAVIPVQADEFRCATCFLICHASRMARNGVCADCA